MSELRKDALEAFKKLLTSIGCTFDEDGTIRSFFKTSDGGVKNPKVKIESLDLVLPTPEQLKLPEGENVVFAPLNENTLAGDSAVFTTLKKLINHNIQFRFDNLLRVIHVLSVSESLKPKGKLLKFLKDAPSTNKSFKAEMARVLTLASKVPVTRNNIGIYVTHKNVKHEGKAVKRLAEVSSPMREALLPHGNAWNVKISKTNRETLIAFIDMILPDLGEGIYNQGSNSNTSPNFAALVGAFDNINERFCYLEELLDDYMPPEFKAAYPSTLKGIGEIKWESLASAFPALAGNNGNVVVGSNKASEKVDTSKVRINEEAAPASNTASAPTAKSEPKTASVDRWSSSPSPTPQQGGSWNQPQQQPQQQHGGWANPQQQQQQQQQNSGWGNSNQSSSWGNQSSGIPNNSGRW